MYLSLPKFLYNQTIRIAIKYGANIITRIIFDTIR